MEEDEEKNAKGSIKEIGKSLAEKAEKAKKAQKVMKIFMNLPTPLKIAIIVVPIAIILIIVLFAGAIYLIDSINFESGSSSKAKGFGDMASIPNTGDSYDSSDSKINKNRIIKIDGDRWKLEINESIKESIQKVIAGEDTEIIKSEDFLRKLKDIKIFETDVEKMTQDELIMANLILNGFDIEGFNSEQLELIPDLLKTELATTAVDLRKIDKMYNGDNYNAYTENEIKEALEKDQILGTIHFKRVISNTEETIPLEYINYEDFKKYLGNFDNYDDIDKALNYFSINDDGQVVIAAWGRNYYELTYDKKNMVKLPSACVEKHEDTYYVKEIKVDGYESSINKYTLPYEVLLALLVSSEDVNFVQDVINLGIQSNIEISIYENYTEITSEDNNIECIVKILNQEMTKRFVKGKYKHYVDSDFVPKSNTYETSEKYSKTEKTISISNTYQYGITLVDNWWIKIRRDKGSSNKTSTSNTINIAEITHEYNPPEQYNTVVKEDVFFRYNSSYREWYDLLSSEEKLTYTSPEMATYGEEVKIIQTIKALTEKQHTYQEIKEEFILSQGISNQKPYNKKDEKFLKAYDENRIARDNISSTPGWLEEYLEQYDENFATIINYLLYVYKNGEDEISKEMIKDLLDLYSTESFNSVNNFSFRAGDIKVKTDEPNALKALTKDELKGVIEKNYSGQQKDNLLSALDGIYKGQEDYNVNGLLTIAVTKIESGCGTGWDLIDQSTYNWISIKGRYKGQYFYVDREGTEWKKYSSFSEAAEDFAALIAESSYYFKAGNVTVSAIAPTYCNEEWGTAVEAEIKRICEGANIEIPKFSGSANVAGGAMEMTEYASSCIGNSGSYMSSVIGFSGQWCAAFACHCYEKFGFIPSALNKKYTYCDSIIDYGKQKGCFFR